MDKERKKLIGTLKKNPAGFLFSESRDIKEELENRREYMLVLLDRERGINAMRKHWSWGLLACIILVVVYDIALATLLGLKVFSFDNQNFVLAFILEGLAKIGGLAYIVIKFLFDKNQG